MLEILVRSLVPEFAEGTRRTASRSLRSLRDESTGRGTFRPSNTTGKRDRSESVVVGGPMLWGSAKRRDGALQSALAKIGTLVAEHLPTLARRRMVLIKVDAYGVADASGWGKECQHFWEKVIRPSLTREEAEAIARAGLGKVMTELVEGPAREECARLEAGFVYDEQMSPLDYERFCAARLESAGWGCELTKGSGDQGADIVARKGGTILVVQCKKYGSAVGNGAVQEAVAAKAHLKAHYAAVVSNATFTRSAIELADSTRTLLLNHAELDVIDARISSV